MTGQVIALCFGFHAFGNDAKAQFGRQLYDGLEDVYRQRVGTDHGNEALVDLQVVDLELAQVVEA